MTAQANALSDTIFFTNISANTANFTLRGGQYGIDVIGTFGTVTLQKLAGDLITFVTVLVAFSAAGHASVNLPGGIYRFALAGASGIYIRLTSVVTAF